MSSDTGSPASAARFSLEDVDRLASLARLSLTDDERARLAHDLENILGYVESLRRVDVSGVPPTTHMLTVQSGMGLREPGSDDPAPGLSREQALSSAPASTEEGFVVPAFVEEG